MTLVVSDISTHGIVMVGDSAVTMTTNSQKIVSSDAAKVQYCNKANIGFALWGDAGIGEKRMDFWLSRFINSHINESDSVESVGKKLVEAINDELLRSNRKWSELVRGIHIAGYRDGLPVLFHVHTGHDTEPAHELRLYKDYPDNQKWSKRRYESVLSFGFVHLRNGYHPIFGPLFDQILNFSRNLRTNFNISFPQKNLSGRFEFYKLLVKFVAGTLIASGLHPGVNNTLSSIAFTENGLEIDERIELDTSLIGEGNSFYGQIF